MPAKNARYILPFLVFLASCAGYVAMSDVPQEVEKVDDGVTLASVRVVDMKPTSHQIKLTSYGEVRSFETTHLAARVSGTVIKRNPKFAIGGLVKRGEVLFTLDKGNYIAAVSESEAQVVAARAVLIEERALARVAARQARKMDKKRVTDLFLRKPQLLSAEARVTSTEAALTRARSHLSNCVVRAPFDALIVSRNIGIGQYVMAGTQVAVLDNIETAEIHIPIAGFDAEFLPNDLSNLAAEVVLKDITKLTRREGKIVRDLGVVDSETRMTNLVVRFDDPYGLNSNHPPIKFGSFVSVAFDGKKLKDAYRIRQDLLRDNLIWVVNSENKLESRVTNILRQEGEFVYIRGGVKSEDAFVLSVPDYPKKGLTVKAIRLEAFN
ncbi:efflux transporter periplasmic adaptor subunit [Veronia nyctiphanis]|uniref:Efflux transporter periplasmic adaptor subunit n=1 Tax=Veronia nyctiphanis TaxID=1278244 RepID=A0A4Q0YSW8_9GAMM|nr:efflux RND transporter periplasmic adaptor subunit [Veronia nyctiphanis]RXJ74276.1 efflux transporter periplasmic adaptor subunit [Veronia nyctiphanis]